MPLITDLANAIRKDEPRNLFCVVELGDHGNVFVFSSGNGWVPKGPNVNRFRDDPLVTFRGDNYKSDGEERMAYYFPEIYRSHGKGAKHITMITAASPCSRVCAGEIVKLAASNKGTIETWTVAYHAPYQGEGPEGFDDAMNTLNAHWNKSPQIRAFKLVDEYIDLKTIHRT